MHFWSIFFPALCSAASWMLSAGPNLARSDYLPLLSSCKMTSEGLPKRQGHTEEYPRNIPESANNIHRGLEQRMYEKEQKGCWNEEKVVGGSCCCLQLPNGRGQRSQSQALFKGAQWEFKKQQTQIGTNEIVIMYNWGKKPRHVCDQTLTQIAQSGCGIFILKDTQNLIGKGPEQVLLSSRLD